MSHIPVLLHEVLETLLPAGKTVERLIDGTLGAGGHSHAFLQAGVRQILAFDLDTQAIALAQAKLADYTDRIRIVHDSYLMMRHYAAEMGWQSVDAILLDLGLSSMQLDTPERGFAFKHDAVLDMRFNKDGDTPSAAYLVNNASAEELAEIFYKYGEEPHGRRIAHQIVKQRPINSTQALADLVAKAMPYGKKSKTHPATQVFQALRIAVNDELATVETAIPMALDLLKVGGRLGVISFHSLEDRIVKQIFKEASTEIITPPGMASIEAKAAQIELITKKPLIPSDAEIAANPRSRSSKLRVVEKL